MGLFDKFKQAQESAIHLTFDNQAVIGEQRHKNNQYIIDKYADSEEPLDILAVAVALDREGAAYRTKAIEYYERFLRNPVEIPIIPHMGSKDKPVRCVSWWQLYSSLATLYEKEHNYEMAVKYLKKLPQESQYSNRSDFTRCGNALMMIDTQLCVDYYKDLMNDPKLEKYKKEFKQRYLECLAELREEQRQEKAEKKAKALNERLEKEYQWITNNLSEIAPKSLSGYKRMKNSNSKNYQNIVMKAKEKGFKIK